MKGRIVVVTGSETRLYVKSAEGEWLWLSTPVPRLAELFARTVGIEIGEVETVSELLDAATAPPSETEAPEWARPPAVNCCEHGDHPAPEGQRFCSLACRACEMHDAPPGRDCAGLCA